MARDRLYSVAFLVAAGIVLSVVGAAAVAIGWLNPRLISDQLPADAAIDAPAVGGAAVALGSAVTALGIAHLAIAVALGRRVAGALTVGVVLTAGMGLLSLGFAVAALVSISSGAAPPILMAVAAVALGVAFIAYAATAAAMIGAQKPPV
jgi:hypothetical protein